MLKRMAWMNYHGQLLARSTFFTPLVQMLNLRSLWKQEEHLDYHVLTPSDLAYLRPEVSGLDSQICVEILRLGHLFPHYHNKSDGVVILKGIGDKGLRPWVFLPNGDANTPDEWVEAFDGQVVIIPRGTPHGFTDGLAGMAKSPPFYALALTSPPPDENDTIYL